jgi:hypothetical protein
MQEDLRLSIDQYIESNMIMLGIQNITKNSTDLSILIEREMIYFDEGSTKSPLLQQAYKHLLTVKSTTVFSSAKFLAAGQICT